MKEACDSQWPTMIRLPTGHRTLILCDGYFVWAAIPVVDSRLFQARIWQCLVSMHGLASTIEFRIDGFTPNENACGFVFQANACQAADLCCGSAT